MKNISDPNDVKPKASPEVSTRRMAIKRIAAVLSGVAAGTGALGRATKAWSQYSSSYIDFGPTYGSGFYTSIYRDTVYFSQAPSYSSYGSYSSSYLSYYTSYRSHYTSVPPP